MQGLSLIRQSSYYYLVLCVIALLFTLLFQGYNDFLWSFILPFFSLLLAFFLYRQIGKSEEHRYIASIFLWSLFLRLVGVYAMSYIMESYNGMPFLSDKDDFQYQEASVAIMQRWKSAGWGFYDDLRFSSNSYSGFPNFSAALMIVFNNTSPMVPRIGNAFLSSLTTVISYIIVRGYISDRSKARFVGIILTVLPITIVFSAMQFKDTLLLFFIVTGLYASISIINGRRISLSVLLLVVSYVGCSFGRPAVIVPMALALLMMLLRSFFTKKQRGNLLIKILSVAVFVYILIYSYQYLNSLGFEDINEYFEQRYSSLSESDIQESEAGVRNMSISQYLGAPLYLLMGLFLPPPLLVSLEDTLNYSAWTVLAHFALLPILIISMWKTVVNRNNNPVPFFLFLVYLFLRIGQANSLMTSFSPRQSLATLFIMYLLIPMYEKGMKTWEHLVIFFSLLTILVYNIVRLISHQML